MTYSPVALQQQRKIDDRERLWHNYIDVKLNAKGTPEKISFKNTENFNFAFDIVDVLAKRNPDKLAMLHISKDKTERRISFLDMKRESARCANYFKSLGIKKGDRVMLILKRHYQFWYAMIGLNKLGAVVIPATNQLQPHDIEYRLNAAGVNTIICTPDDNIPEHVEEAAKTSPTLINKIIVPAATGGCTGSEGQDDYQRRLQRYAQRIRERMRGRAERDEALRVARRGQCHYEAGPLEQQFRRGNDIHHGIALHRVCQTHHPGRHQALGVW